MRLHDEHWRVYYANGGQTLFRVLWPRREQPVESRARYSDEQTYRRTRLPVSSASTLIPEAYTDGDFFTLERERVFGTTWLAAAVSDDLATPGDVVATEVADQPIFITRSADGQLHGFHNVCRHRGAALFDCGRHHIRGRIRCPYHSWTYDLDGHLLGTPLFTSDSPIPGDQRAIFDMSETEDFDRAEYGLHPVAVTEWGPLIFANLEATPEPLSAQLGDLPERLAGYRMSDWRLARTAAYDIQANYKLVGENFMEYYHLPWVHPGLVKVSPLEAHHRWQGRGMYTGMCTQPIADNAEQGGWKGLPPMPRLSENDATAARFIWLFPNTAINVLPNHIFVMVANPVSPERTIETTYLFVPRELERSAASPADISSLAEFWDAVNREDIAIVERVQRGLRSRAYAGGRMCYRFEEPLHRYQNMIIDRMIGTRRVPPADADRQRPMFGPVTSGVVR